MASAPALPIDQDAIWNGPAGNAWVDLQPLLDSIFQPVQDLLIEAVRVNSATNVLDIGCGTGATTLAIQQAIGESGQSTGLDISGPMLALASRRAQERGSRARFICRNVELAPLEDRDFDMILSRFGVMFFTDPVRAFGHVWDAAADGAKLLAVVWRGPAENAFMTTAERAAAAHLPELPARDPAAPGQFAFADPDRVERILVQSGWRDIAIQPFDFECSFPSSRLGDYISRLGPLGLMMEKLDTERRKHLIELVGHAFAPFVHAGQVRFTAACWTVRAGKS